MSLQPVTSTQTQATTKASLHELPEPVICKLKHLLAIRQTPNGHSTRQIEHFFEANAL